jgi:phage antirepressor YoqD-like protein
MNETALFNERAMTAREAADTLGVDERTIQRITKRLFPEVVRNGVTTLLNEAQATAVKSEIGKGRTDLDNIVEVGNIRTDLEMTLQAQECLRYFMEKAIALEKEMASKNAQIAELKPKAETLDKITATESDISVRELAAILAVPHLGRNNLFQKLRDDGYIDGFNRPYRNYVEGGLMYEKEYYVPQMDATKQQLRITQKGVAHFAGKYAPSKTACGIRKIDRW